MIRYLKLAAERLHLAPRWISLGCCGVILAGCAKSATNSEKVASPGKNKNAASALLVTNSAPTLVQIPPSAFSTNVDEGHDPFFPDSTRRLPKVAGSPARIAKPAQATSDLLKLTGLWPNKKHPLALINNTTIGPGEAANVTVLVLNGQNKPELQKLLVRCLEVRQNSVLIRIEGEPGTKELILQSRL